MRRTELLFLAITLAWLVRPGLAQVVAPVEIQDPEMRELQQKHMAELKDLGAALATHGFPYPFYFSRVLDLDQEMQKRRDQRSIEFKRFRDQPVLQVTGNYYASYSAELLSKEDRARQTFHDVMLPILKEAVPRLEQEKQFRGFALEISHHVRRKMLGVSTERAENVMLYLPKTAAALAVAAHDEQQQKAAVLQGLVLVNGQPASLWPGMQLAAAQAGEQAPASPKPPPGAPVSSGSSAGPVKSAALPGLLSPPGVMQTAVPRDTAAPPAALPKELAPAPAHEVSASDLQSLQKTYQETLDRMARELEKTAHFVSYAPPSFIEFHKSSYLQLSLTTGLPQNESGSRYRAAALAFDSHVAQLIRPVLGYFPKSSDFDGISFSTTVRFGAAEGSNAQSVEFFLPLSALRCYEQYDCTGQEIINAGFVLINGERASLDLQAAESGSPR